MGVSVPTVSGGDAVPSHSSSHAVNKGLLSTVFFIVLCSYVGDFAFEKPADTMLVRPLSSRKLGFA